MREVSVGNKKLLSVLNAAASNHKFGRVCAVWWSLIWTKVEFEEAKAGCGGLAGVGGGSLILMVGSIDPDWTEPGVVAINTAGGNS